MNLRIIGTLLLIFAFYGHHVAAQTNVEVFGQNRVQYRRFDWKYYDASHFKIYHYDRAGRELARYVAEQAEQDVAAIERRLGGLFPERLNIILYNSYDEYQQTNIGLNSDLQMQNENPAGMLNLAGDKLVMYFTGTHADLKRQLRQGMAQVVMERILFGENLREMVRNALLLNLPKWATAGYVDYVVDGWSTDDDNSWKNLVANTAAGKKANFHELSEANPALSGKAYWKYIATKYGENNVKNLLYLTQLKSSMNKALKLTINQKLRQSYDSLMQFYQARYAFEEQLFEPVDTGSLISRIDVPTDEGRIRDVTVSPRGTDVAYVKWLFGEWQVILENRKVVNGKEIKEKAVLLQGGVKNHNETDDPDYPLLSWNNTGFKLGIIFKNRDRIRIRIYNSVKAKIEDFRVPAKRFDRVTGFTFMEDDDVLLMTAVRMGQSDIFEYRLKGGRTRQVTDDAWDDVSPVFVSGGSRKGILFLSNRPQPYIDIKPLPNELPIGPMNAFFYNSTTQSYDLMQLTHNQKGTITQPVAYGQDHFAYLNDQNGIRNRYVVMFARDVNNRDSAYSVPMTNFGRNILYHQYNPASGKIADVIQTGNQFGVYFHKIALPPPDGTAAVRKPLPISFIDGVTPAKKIHASTDAPVNLLDKEELAKAEDKDFVVQGGNAFQSEFTQRGIREGADSASVAPGPESEALANKLSLKKPNNVSHLQQDDNNDPLAVTSASGNPDARLNGKRVLYVDSSFIDMRSQKYYLSFKPDFYTLRADNSVLFNRYQSYDNSGGQWNNPSVGGMFMASLTDKMEDYRFTGGIRIPVNFSGTTYYAQFENFRRRVDWGVIFLRQQTKSTYTFSTNQGLFDETGKNATTMLQATASYPLDKVRSFRLNFGARQDNFVIKAQDLVGLLLPSTQTYWAMSRAEFVYDDTRNPATNIWNGLRYKFFGEYMYKIHSNNVYANSNDTNGVNNSPGGFFNVGVDFRYYQKIYKNFIFAIRAAGAHSMGTQKIIYYLGGVDNALNADFSNALPPSGKNDYAFQALATNLRGYDQNARNGNTYAVVNAELRFPVLTTLLKRPIESSLLKNLQMVGFCDIGSAWEGFLPNSENFDRYFRLNWPSLSSPTVQLSVPNYSDNGLALGYGLGLRTQLFGYFVRADAALNIRRDFVWYLSLGTDF
ncbi:MAG: hypothetical protein QM642_11120 [Edaphocola sp.]